MYLILNYSVIVPLSPAPVSKKNHKNRNKEKAEEYLQTGIKNANEFKAPKTSAAIFLWKSRDSDFDDLWSSLIGQNTDFALLAAKTSARKDYRDWVNQHKSWNFTSTLQEKKDEATIRKGGHIAILVGRFGETKEAVQCAPV